jgi:preprotein translocase subunit Sss1
VVGAAPPWTGEAPLSSRVLQRALHAPRHFTERAPPPRARPRAEFSKIAQATSVGFFIMGFIGFFVKLIFIPINNIIVGMS